MEYLLLICTDEQSDAALSPAEITAQTEGPPADQARS